MRASGARASRPLSRCGRDARAPESSVTRLLKRHRPAAFVIAALAALLAVPASVDAQTARNRAGSPGFTSREEKIIRDYFAAYPADTAGVGEAPQPVKGKRLPPGADGRALPRDLAIRLKPPPRGYQRLIVDNDVVIVATRGGAIADVILDAW